MTKKAMKPLAMVVSSTLFLWSAPFLTTAFSEDLKQGKETQNKAQLMEKRIADLESAIKLLLEEKRTKTGESKPKEEPLPRTKNIVPEASKTEIRKSADNEWGEPDVAKETAKGRDEDARRRLTELETWKRKADAKTAKEAEEAADKVKIDISGKYKLRYNVRDNLNLGNPSQSWKFDNTAYFDQRFQLKIESSYGPLASTILLDKGSFSFDWKDGSEGTLERWTGFQPVSSALVRELNLQYTGAFIVKAGRQVFKTGNGGIIVDGPMDSLKVVVPLGKTPIGTVSGTAAYISVSGGYRDYNGITNPPGVGDRSISLFGVDTKLDGILASFDIKPDKNLTIQPYVLKVFDRGDSGDPDLNLDKDYNTSTVPRDRGFEPLWTGIAVSGRKGGFSYTGDFVYLSGTYSGTRDFNANALLLRGDYNLQKVGPLDNFSLGFEFGRGSGNSAEEKVSGTGDVKDFTALFLCKDRRKFGNIFSEDIRAGYFLADSNLANVSFARALMSFEPVKNWKIETVLSKLWTTEKVFEGQGPVRDWSLGTSTSTEKTRDIGWEADLNLDFPIYKRLRGFVEAGYFIPGDAYRLPDGGKAGNASKIVLGSEFEF